MKAVSLHPERRIIRNFNRKSPILQNLYGAYMDSIDPTISLAQFYHLYFNEELVEIDLTVYYHSGVRAGFSAAFYYATTVNGKKCFIARSATGLIPALQGKGLHDRVDLYFKFIRFLVKHPFTPIWVAAYVINPFVFRDLCRLVPAVFPAPGRQIPCAANQILDFMAESGGHARDPLHPLSLEVPIQVHFNDALRQRIYASKDQFVKWYLEQNPNFLDKYGLLVVIGITRSNVQGTLANFTRISVKSGLNSASKNAKANAGNFWRKIVNLVRTIFMGRIL